MANQFALNTAAYPGFGQLLIMTGDGLFDFKAQQVGGKVTVPATETKKLFRLRNYRPNSGGALYLVES